MSTTRRSTSDGDGATEQEGGREIEVVNRQRIYSIDRESVAQLSRDVLDRIGREDAGLTITFIRDSAMRGLNRDYRGVDEPTDVLSFAYHEDADPLAPAADRQHLGDIAISVDTADRYARELGLTFKREIDLLVIHGTLHLAGYDHETDDGEMNRLEKKLRKELIR
jgi:probable rRNA maturation factor